MIGEFGIEVAATTTVGCRTFPNLKLEASLFGGIVDYRAGLSGNGDLGVMRWLRPGLRPGLLSGDLPGLRLSFSSLNEIGLSFDFSCR